ncbi:putative membrane protein YkoI [Streptomyces zagrosensis]|uniref:Putative membrane protein YkoI n=1 Tax=Streptomyces zagrosensis TaxID=1042984 RepID=A0A7W9QFQ8_9ACTN|nr:putative membrane protein YkoI [Streptomyces zagrosensis]
MADDLSANRGEQERVRTELARLQDDLVRLEESEQVLTQMQKVLGGTSKRTAKQSKSRKTAAVPAARRSNGKAAAGKQAAATGRKAPKKAASTKKPGEPTWLELTTAYLGGQSEPKSAAEVSDALTEAHPERTVQVTVVRNTLEQGVAQGLLERSKQGRSVFYSLATTATAPSDS